MDLSIVIPVYNEAEALGPFYIMLKAAVDDLPQSAEIVFCNDGSTDGSAAVLDDIARSDERVTVVHLRRNYGQT
ncbi:MAG TPA: glycosyltransferase, partial [Acetobacteraceae bacterium]